MAYLEWDDARMKDCLLEIMCGGPQARDSCVFLYVKTSKGFYYVVMSTWICVYITLDKDESV